MPSLCMYEGICTNLLALLEIGGTLLSGLLLRLALLEESLWDEDLLDGGNGTMAG